MEVQDEESTDGEDDDMRVVRAIAGALHCNRIVCPCARRCRLCTRACMWMGIRGLAGVQACRRAGRQLADGEACVRPCIMCALSETGAWREANDWCSPRMIGARLE